MSQWSDPQYLRNAQYKSSVNLRARIQIHERFSLNPMPWFDWVFDQLALPAPLPADARLLELGCGPGGLWVKNWARLPQGWRLTLSDFSLGMVGEARQNLANGSNSVQVIFANADAQYLPFPSASFDAVLANHMLYHVPDRALAFAEIRRVLRPGGRFYAATNGREHMKELYSLAELMSTGWAAIATSVYDTRGFGLENGGEQLAGWFPHVEQRQYPDGLRVTEVEPLVDYIGSMITRQIANPSPAQIAAFRRSLENEIAARGAIKITKATGLFVAW